MNPGRRNQISRNKDSGKRSPVEKCGKASKNRTAKKQADKKRLDQRIAVKSQVGRKRDGRKNASKSRVARSLSGSRIVVATPTAETAFPRTGFAPSSDESITSPCIGPKSSRAVRAFSMVGTRLCWLIPGHQRGLTATIATLTMSMASIFYLIRATPKRALHSSS